MVGVELNQAIIICMVCFFYTHSMADVDVVISVVEIGFAWSRRQNPALHLQVQPQVLSFHFPELFNSTEQTLRGTSLGLWPHQRRGT